MIDLFIWVAVPQVILCLVPVKIFFVFFRQNIFKLSVLKFLITNLLGNVVNFGIFFSDVNLFHHEIRQTDGKDDDKENLNQLFNSLAQWFSLLSVNCDVVASYVFGVVSVALVLIDGEKSFESGNTTGVQSARR